MKFYSKLKSLLQIQFTVLVLVFAIFFGFQTSAYTAPGDLCMQEYAYLAWRAENSLLRRIWNVGTYPFTKKSSAGLTTTPLLRKYREENIKWLNVEERKEYQVTVLDGFLYQKGKTIPNGYYIYVLDGDGNLYISHSAVGVWHHSTLAGAEPVAGAGDIAIENGKITFIGLESGHYRPSKAMLWQTIKWMQGMGVDFSGTRVRNFIYNPPDF